MKFLNANESAATFRTLSDARDAGSELRVDFSGVLDRSLSLARLILELTGTGRLTFLWIREFGIWPSLENWTLFNALRSASGLTGKSLTEIPGHEFGPDDSAEAASYLQILLLNGWGGVFVGHRQRIAISHDSWLSIKSSPELSAQKSRVDEFGLPSRMEAAPQSLLLF